MVVAVRGVAGEVGVLVEDVGASGWLEEEDLTAQDYRVRGMCGVDEGPSDG